MISYVFCRSITVWCMTIFVSAQCSSTQAANSPSQSETLGPTRLSVQKLIDIGLIRPGEEQNENLKRLEKEAKKIKNEIEDSRLLMSRGGIDTGGGTIITSPTGTGLLDLYLYAPEIFYDQKIDPANIEATKSLRTLGIDRVLNTKNPLIEKTRDQISKWKSSSPIMTDNLLDALKTLAFYYHNAEITSPPVKFFLPQGFNITENQLRMVALYVPNFGVHIGLKDLQSLPEKHQIALIIHECLRLLKSVGQFTFSDEILQKITAAVMIGPENIKTKVKTIDTLEYLAGPQLLNILEQVIFFEKSDQSIAEFCSYYQKNRDAFLIPPFTPDLKCETPPKKLEFEEVKEMLETALAYISSHPKLRDYDLLQTFFFQFELLKIQARNLKLKALTGKMSYYSTALNSQSKKMHFDSIIDEVNESSFWFNEQLVMEFKSELEWYLNQAQIKLNRYPR